ncbi:MAG: uncharacterized protein JWP33_2443 [Blastococcus sp.]|jgi:hypothetical protein|nr:uncharacterized protein [Blastococcus sp.]
MTKLGTEVLVRSLDAQARVDAEFRRMVAGWHDSEQRSAMWYAWIFIVGVLIVAAAVAWVYCRWAGYRGFRGGISVKRGPWGVTIGTYLECY